MRLCVQIRLPLILALSHGGLALHAQTVTISPVDGLGGSFVSPMALNNRGEITGVSYTAGNTAQHAFLFTGGQNLDLGTIGGTYSSGMVLNQLGEVAGESTTANDAQIHAFGFTGGSMHDLGTLGGTFSTAAAINDTGAIAGYSYTAQNAQSHAFLSSGGSMQDLGTLGGKSSSAIALNSAGLVAGNSTLLGDLRTHAFLYAGSMQDLQTLGGNSSFAAGLNDLGQVVGESQTASGQTHAFLYRGSGMEDLGTLGGTFSTAYAINQAGQIAGDASTTGNAQTHAFLYTGGQMKDLGTLGGGYSTSYALNNAGHVVGDSINSVGLGRAFLWKDDVMTDLNSLLPPDSGWDLYSAQFINDAGQIIGLGLYQGAFRWFLMNTVSAVNQPPEARAGDDQTVECQGNQTVVHLDGRQSSDPESEELTYAWFEGETLLGTEAQIDVGLAFGSHTIKLQVKDPQNQTGEDTVLIQIVDTTDPVITCPADVQLAAGNDCTAAIPDFLAAATVSDNCSGPGGLQLEQNPAAGSVVGLGEYLVELSVRDQAGNRATCRVRVTVADQTAPSVECPANMTLSAGADCQAILPNLLPGVTVSDNCSAPDHVTLTQAPPAGTLLPVGSHPITVTARDGAGNQATCTTIVTVRDTTAPAFAALSISPADLGAPNHQMVPVTVTAQVTDNCDPQPRVELIAICSNEPVTGPGDKTTPDWEITGPLTANLRAERAGKANRIYTLTIRATDAGGNSSTSQVSVTVTKGNN